MTREARLMSGIILLTAPTIQYGGYFLLTSLTNKGSGDMENPLRQNFSRAGHAHVSVIVILSLVCQMLADGAVLPDPLLWFVRIGVPLAAILISSGLFFSVMPPAATQASGAVVLMPDTYATKGFMCCTHNVLRPVGITEVAERQQGVPLDMSRIHPECSGADTAGRSGAADALLRQEPGEEEEEEEDDGKEDNDDNDNDDDGYSE